MCTAHSDAPAAATYTWLNVPPLPALVEQNLMADCLFNCEPKHFTLPFLVLSCALILHPKQAQMIRAPGHNTALIQIPKSILHRRIFKEGR